MQIQKHKYALQKNLETHEYSGQDGGEKENSLPGKLSLCIFFAVQVILVVLSLGSN